VNRLGVLFSGALLCCTGGMSMTARTARPPFRVCLLAVTLLTVDDRHCSGS
jgi:hypothetical protein